MDTYEARTHLRDLGQDALLIVVAIVGGQAPSAADRQKLRQAAIESRSVLADAGYPGEGVWQGIQRASLGLDTALQDSDPLYWQDVEEQLRWGVETLEALVSPRQTDVDFRIVG